MDTTQAGLIVSIITAIGLFVKIIVDNRNNSMTSRSGYLDSLVKNVENLTKQNANLQTQINDKQEQIDDKQKQIDHLEEKMDNILNGKYQIVLNITAGKKFSIDEAVMKSMETP